MTIIDKMVEWLEERDSIEEPVEFKWQAAIEKAKSLQAEEKIREQLSQLGDE